MIFVIEFDRAAYRRLRTERFDDARREAAAELRLAWEIEAAKADLDREVVILEAREESDLRQTHRRYFETVDFERVDQLVTHLEKAGTK